MRVLVTGGVRSGKSRHAEALLGGHRAVTYVAPAPTAEEEADPDWAERIAAHRARRPPGWTTVESRDLAGVIAAARGPVLVDCLGTWLTGTLDDRRLWEEPVERVQAAVEPLLVEVAARLADVPDAVVVTNEVGLGVVPAHRSGRLFRDLLGTVNQRVAEVCDEVHLVVAGRVLVL